MLLMKLNKIGKNIVDVMSSINFVTIGLMHVSMSTDFTALLSSRLKKNNKKSTFFSNYNRNRLETFANYRLNKYQFLA